MNENNQIIAFDGPFSRPDSAASSSERETVELIARVRARCGARGGR
jgi:hypothetical protein